MDITFDNTVWPPPFTIKRSARARHVRLRTSVRDGLELVVPLRFNLKHIPEVLENHKNWIIKQLSQVSLKALDLKNLPTEIAFLACNRAWKIHYLNSDHKKLHIIERPGNELVLSGRVADKALCKKTLVSWAKDQAKSYLTARLEHVSTFTGLKYTGVTIRNQRSRWGSCSALKVINLNYKLIFLPEALADYILIHELSHTVHMNHSARFWRLVAKWDVNWKEHSRVARSADAFVPGWALE